ncbi:lysylphosphatidylglycerol synthase domain-containing protein [Prochlorococcus marinus]|uniref:Transmembrane protein HieC n=1 Tax=Prochlorococcus marinus (strain MIT 9211) TaxID=93059 RepID=A9BEB0_PROM4|nr:lysylphosphatidylglycerol synthase domain-containing protein [Prochlorococcus marinus]ABX08420.1 conserved hypothetical protein [Prochlorococcus marinus str. MIT 9211]
MMNFLTNFYYFVSKFKNKINLPGGLKLWVTFCCFSFIGYSIFNNFGQLSQQSFSRLSLLFIFSGFLVSWLSLIINAIAWKKIISWLGYNSNEIKIIPIFLSTNLLKYMPGGVWHFLERFRLLRKKMPSDKAFYCVLLEPFFMIFAALFWVPFGDFNLIVFILCFSPLFFLSNRFITPFALAIKRLKISDFRKHYSISSLNESSNLIPITSSNYPYEAVLAEIFFVALRFTGFWFCLKAFSIDHSLYFTKWLSAFSLSWMVGLIVPSAPGGVGVFEAFILFVIGDGVSEPLLISALLCYRLIVSLADLFAAIFIPKNQIRLLSTN